mgnify:CR=1 FL=1
MKRVHFLVITLLSASFIFAANVFAQDAPRFSPVEGFTCTYNKGKGPKDMAKVNAKWNAFMDKNQSPGYNAWNLVPNFTDDLSAMDFAWLGVWQNGNDMGKALDIWNSKGSAISAEYAKVATCSNHFNMASYTVRMPDMNSSSKTGVVTFSDCSLSEGKTFPDMMAALDKWAKHLDSTGSKAGMWVFFPVYGAGDVEWTFKMVEGHSGFSSLGFDWENYGNKGGYMKAQEILNGVIECGDTRVYNSEMIRDGGVKPG